MKNFFSAIQGKFDAKYHGRYLGNIIEQIAAMRRDVVYPLIKVAPLEHGRWPLSSVQNVDAESLYLSEDHRINDRRADLQITLESNVRTARILIEIKMHDQFLKGQLEDYVQWVRGRGAEDADDRAVVVLTAFPLSEVEDAYLRANRALIDADLWQSVQDRLAQIGLRLIDNIHADHVCVALLRGVESVVFGEMSLDANNNVELPRDAVSLLVVLWSLIILPKRERQAARDASAEGDLQDEMFRTERPMPTAATVSPLVSYKALLADFGTQLGRKTRMDGNLKRLETHGFIVRRGDDIAEGPLLDLLLEYDALAPRILDGALGEILAHKRRQAEAVDKADDSDRAVQEAQD